MQTFLYVLGPFILQACLGLAAIILALGFVLKVLVPKAKLMSHDLHEIAVTESYAWESHQLVCDLVVELDRNQILEDALSSQLYKQVQALNRPIVKRKELE